MPPYFIVEASICRESREKGRTGPFLLLKNSPGQLILNPIAGDVTDFNVTAAGQRLVDDGRLAALVQVLNNPDTN